MNWKDCYTLAIQQLKDIEMHELDFSDIEESNNEIENHNKANLLVCPQTLMK